MKHLCHVGANLLGNFVLRNKSNKMDGDPLQFGCVQFVLAGTGGRPIFNVVIHINLVPAAVSCLPLSLLPSYYMLLLDNGIQL